MREIRLYGELGRRFGREHHFEVATPAEAIKALCHQVKGFKAYLREHREDPFAVLVDRVSLGEGEFSGPVGRMETIKIVPVVAGGSNGLKMVAGAVLIVVGAVVNAYFPGSGTPFIQMGVGLMIGGVVGYLTQAAAPTSASSTADSEPTNYTFGSPRVTNGQGYPVPLGYGKFRVGGALISSGIASESFQSLGFGGMAPDDSGTKGGDGNSVPWAWSVAPESDTEASGISEQLRFIQALSEGPILGLVNGLQSVYLDDTPIQSPSGSFNIHGINLAMSSGTANQAAIPGFPSIETPYDVSVKVTNAGGAIARTISTPNLSAVRIRIKYPSMQTVDKTTGDVSAASAQISVTIQNANYNGGVAYPVTLSEGGTCKIKSSSAYTKAWRIELPQGISGPWTISVTRVTEDSTSNYLMNDTWWADYTELTDELLRYPYTAVMGISVDAKSFNSVPELTAECYLRIIQVPSNYDTDTRTYSGIWDGTFKWAWSDNPAWCWYDLATNTRYGCGTFLQASGMDKWALYDIAQWCDEQVDNGLGGKEPRMTMNIFIQTQEEAIKVLSELASCFWGIAYYAAGSVTAVADWDKEPVALFTNANVQDGKFTYSGSAKKARHTSAVVTWMDPSLGYATNQEIYEYEDARSRYGYNPLTGTAIGSTSRGQSRRFGQWEVLSEFFGTDTVSFTAGLDGSLLLPGDIFQVQDNHRAGSTRWGGRLWGGCTTTTINLDGAVALEVGKNYYLKVWGADGSVAVRQVLSGPGTWAAITTAPFDAEPSAMAVWVLQEEADAKLYRAISISEKSGLGHDITGLLHVPEKYSLIGVGNDFETATTDNPEYPRPVNLAAGVSISSTSGVLSVRVTPTWEPVQNYTPSSYQLAYRYQGGAWTPLPVQGLGAEITGHGLGLYEFKCYAVYRTRKSAAATWSITADITGNPPNVTGLTWAYKGTARISWDAVNDARGVDYEVRMGTTWDTAMVLGRFSGLTFDAVAAGTYWVAAYFMGLYSVTPASVIIPASGIPQNVVQTWDEKATSWAGTFGGGCAADGLGAICLTSGLTGTYEVPTSHVVDIGTAQPCSVSVAYLASTSSLNNDWDSQTNFDAWADVDGNVPGMGTVTIQIALSQNGTTWGDWQTFIPGSYLARRFKLRAVLTRADTTVTQYLSALSWTVDMPDRTAKGTGVSVSASGLAVTFSPAFQVIPNVQITITNMQAGDIVTFPVVPSTSGFTVKITNGGTGVARTINWTALGY